MSNGQEDPLVTSGRREAALVLGLFVIALLYTVGYCYLFGYGRDPATLTFVLWFPDWVFWGIVVPWLACVLISTVFAMRFMHDADLERELAAGDAGQGSQETHGE